MSLTEILFLVFASTMVASSLGVILHKNPIKASLFLVSFFIGLAAMYALLGGYFLATVQILVYVGAIMVLFIFVIMLIPLREENFDRLASGWGKKVIIALLILSFSLQMIVLTQKNTEVTKTNHIHTSYENELNFKKEELLIKGNTETLSFILFSNYFLPFEAISLLLLVAMIGSVMLAKKSRRKISD